MLIKQLFEQAKSRLTEAGVAEPEREAELLVEHVCAVDRAQLFLSGDKSVADREILQYEDALCRRCAREPLAYIVGEQEFWSLSFKVTPAVLIPRPETELLIEAVLRFAREREQFLCGPILDVGTGSGIIAVVLARELPDVRVVAIDRSTSALAIAKENACTHGVADRICFLASDLMAGMRLCGDFPLIVSNPPYIVEGALAGLQQEVRSHEPRLALNGGPEGLSVISRLARELENFLAPGGGFFMEIGFDQEQSVLSLFRDLPFLIEQEVFSDYSGLPRIFQAKRKSVG